MRLRHKESLDRTYTQSTPMVYFVCDAQWYSKYSFFIRRNAANPLWSDVVNPAFLHMLVSQKASARACRAYLSQSRIPHIGIVPFLDLRHNHGTAAYQQDRYSARQRFLSPDARRAAISRSVYPSPLSQTPATVSDSSPCSTSRQPQSSSVCSSLSTSQLDSRRGLHRYRHLRRSAERRCRLQSEEARSKIVSSIAVFRSLLSGVLAWKPSSRQHRRNDGSDTVHQGMPGEGTVHNRQEPNTIPHGLRLLLAAHHQLSGCRRLWIRYCRKGIQADQKTGMCLHIRADGRRLGSGGVSSQDSSSGQRRASFCCRQTPDTVRRGRSRAIDAVQAQEICVPCLCLQPSAQPLAGVSVLQSPCDYREKYPRTHVRLSAGQNPDCGLDGKRGVFPDSVVCRKHRALVQETLPFQGISQCYTGYDPRRFPRTPCPIGEIATQKHCQAAQGLSLSRFFPPSISNDRVFTRTRKFSYLQKARSPPHSERHLKLPIFTLF